MVGRWAGPDLATTLRRGILALVGLGIAGTTIELVFLGHADSLLQALVWPGVAALAAGAWLAARRAHDPRARTVVRALAAVALAVGLIGVGIHVWANLEAAPLDRDYEAVWATMPALEQWWLAITGGVGPAPTLAPGALVEIGLALLLATIQPRSGT